MNYATLVVGLLLATVTAIHCVAYETLSKRHGLFLISLLNAVIYVIVGACAYCWNGGSEAKRCAQVSPWWALLYLGCGVMTLMWYWLTTRNNVLLPSLFEIAYAMMLFVWFLVARRGEITLRTAGGAVLVMIGVLLLSVEKKP